MNSEGRKSLLLVCASLLALIVGCRERGASVSEHAYHAINGYAMGTTWSVKYEGPIEEQSQKEIRSQLDASLEHLENKMSTWRDDTEISRFNRSDSTNWVEVSLEVIAVVEQAQQLSRESGGAFDITTYPLIRAWGFGGGEPPNELPDGESVRALLSSVGYSLLETRTEPPALRKLNPKTQIDLSALAKGYAVDALAKVLEDRECTNYLVEIGGELRGRGLREKGGAWRVGIEDPIVGESHVGDVAELGAGALASSGDYRNNLPIAGKRYAHIVDPKSGWPLLQRGVAVSVLADNCMEADAWATALTVIGRTNGIQLANTSGLAVMFRYREQGSIAVTQSVHWPR